MGKNEYLCPCLKITKKDIKEAIADGADSFTTAKKKPAVSLKCGPYESLLNTHATKHLKIHA